MGNLLNFRFFERWLIAHPAPGETSIIKNQIQQVWVRFLLGGAGLLYLYFHAPFFEQYKSFFLPTVFFYFSYNLISVPLIRRRPISIPRILFSPVLDIFVVSFSILIDGGHISGIYLILLVIIFGNGLRWGNALMLYSQALAMLGLISVSILMLIHTNLQINRAMLMWQLAALALIPYYVYLISGKAEKTSRNLQEAERTSMHILDQGPLPVFTFDLDPAGTPRILYANAATNNICQDDYTQLIGSSPDLLTIQEDAKELLRFCSELLMPHQPKYGNTIYVRGKNVLGDTLQLAITGSRLRWQDRLIGICFILDLTDRGIARPHLERLTVQGALSTFTAGIVHDFRNILTNIIGNAEILLEESKDKLTREHLTSIIDAGERGAELIKRLLTTSNDSTSLAQISRDTIKPETLSNILGFIRIQLPNHIRLHYNISETLPKVDVSTVEIEQILVNLVQNSAQAIIGPGKISVLVSSDTSHPLANGNSPCLAIHVRDSGAGIAEKDLEHIFKPFWTTRSEQGGTGLGLANVKRIVRKHGGTIEVHSEIGKGTDVDIYFPSSKKNSRSLMTPTSEFLSHQSPNHQNLRILLVDDAPDVLNIHKAMLKRMGYQVVTAGDGKEALEKIQMHPSNYFDLVITDYRMPYIDGIKLIAQISKSHPYLPTIMITAYGDEIHLEEVLKMGGTILYKPVDFDLLQQTIVGLIRKGKGTG